MNSSHKWKKGKCSDDQVVPDIDFDRKLDKRKYAKTFESRLNARNTISPSVPINGTNNSTGGDNGTNGHAIRGYHQSTGIHNDKNHNSISTLDEFWEERYSRILTHNIFNNSINPFNESK